MLAENINAGQTNWANPSLNSAGFMLPLTPGAASAGATPTGAMPSVTEVDSKHSNDGSEPNSTDVPMQDMKHTDRQPSPASSEETDRSFSQDVADESLADVPPHDQQDQAPQDDTRSIGVSP